MSEPEGQEATQAPEHTEEDEKFMRQFRTMRTEHIIRAYEEKNRARILAASLAVRSEFDRVWELSTGSPYFQAVTTIGAPPPQQGRSDPKSRNYRARVRFKEIYWSHIRRRLGKKPQTLYIIDGVAADTGRKRPLYTNLRSGRLYELLGDTLAEQIVQDAKGSPMGSFEVNVELEVEGFWEVQFSPKGDVNDTDDVILSHEGNKLLIQRMKPVVLPGFWLEICDNALKAIYIQTPQEKRKITSWVQTYQYTTLREATIEDYLTLKAEGDRLTKEARRKEEYRE